MDQRFVCWCPHQQTSRNDDLLNWLLEEDNPGVRYLALRELLELPETDRELIESREKAHQAGPISLWQYNAFPITLYFDRTSFKGIL